VFLGSRTISATFASARRSGSGSYQIRRLRDELRNDYATWAFPAAYAVAAAAGITDGFWLRPARPAVHQGIGQGAET
jgi:hypothetical protein